MITWWLPCVQSSSCPTAWLTRQRYRGYLPWKMFVLIVSESSLFITKSFFSCHRRENPFSLDNFRCILKIESAWFYLNPLLSSIHRLDNIFDWNASSYRLWDIFGMKWNLRLSSAQSFEGFVSKQERIMVFLRLINVRLNASSHRYKCFLKWAFFSFLPNFNDWLENISA